MRITGGGNVGIGVTPNVWDNSTFRVIQIGSSIPAFLAGRTDSFANVQLGVNAFFDGSWKYVGNDFATRYFQTAGAHAWQTAPSGTAGNAISFTQAMTLDASGRLGIGTSSPSTKLTVYGGYTSFTDGTIEMYAGTDGSGGLFGTTTNHYQRFITNNTERMRIFASGNVKFSSQVYGNTVASPRTLYIASDGELGGISSIRASKTNIEQLDSNWLMQLNPVSFNYRKKDEDGNYTDEHYDELFYGLIAEETELVNKEICTYNDDKLVGIEYSKLVPVLVKAIQELKAEIDELKAK
jgi:hypothetical protein